MFSDVWSENAALVKRLVKIHSNPPPYKSMTKDICTIMALMCFVWYGSNSFYDNNYMSTDQSNSVVITQPLMSDVLIF